MTLHRSILNAILACAAMAGRAGDVQAPARDLKAFFLRTCATCHGADGSGRAPTGQRLVGRALADAKWQAKQKDSDLVKVIYLGKGSMPGYKGQLSEEEVKLMVADVVRPLALKK